MAGHSHAANVKWRKDRQAQVRSQEHQKARKKIELLIQQEKRVSEKALSVAREHSFPKEKVYQIWERWKQKQAETQEYFAKLYQAPFAIIIYCEGKKEKVIQETVSSLSQELHWKEINPGNPSHYFRKINLLEIETENNLLNLEEHLLMNLPEEIINKLEQVETKNNQVRIIFAEKAAGEVVENLFLKQGDCFIKSKKNLWQPLVFSELVSPEAQKYGQNLKQKLRENQTKLDFFTNINFYE